MALIQATTMLRKIVYFPPSVRHHSSVLLPADTMSAFQTAGKFSPLSTPRNRGFAKARSAERVRKQRRSRSEGGEIQHQTGEKQNQRFNENRHLLNKISRLERKSPGLRTFPPPPQRLPATAAGHPPLASGPFLHPGSSGSL